MSESSLIVTHLIDDKEVVTIHDEFDVNLCKNSKTLIKVIIPNSVTHIGKNLIKGCRNLKTINIILIKDENKYVKNYFESLIDQFPNLQINEIYYDYSTTGLK